MFDKIKKWYSMSLWNKTMVLKAVEMGVITQEQCEEILGGNT